MPRTIADILAHADELAAQFEAYEPAGEKAIRADALVDLRAAVIARAAAERTVLASVAAARRSGHSWAAIGSMMGTTGEAARQRYRDVETAVDDDAATTALDRRNAELLAKAGFTPDELREFAGVLHFAEVLADAGQVGPVADIEWTPEKAEALIQVFRGLGFQPGLPPGATAGPEIRIRTAKAEPLPFSSDADESDQARC